MKLSDKTQYIFNEVKKIISPVYLVGGLVRDEILGKDSNDYDFTTPLSPDEIEERVHKVGKRAFIVGKRFGTIAFKVEYEGIQYMVEVTTFRAETYNENDRKPNVEFVKDIVQDLSRRDFTINSMAIREDGRLLDPFHGKKDLDDKVIRAVGNPTIRFKEDPLRLLRACRFVAKLNFKIEDKTFKSICKNAHHILSVSKERWMQEMDKLLLSDYADIGLYYLWKTKLFLYMIPELDLQWRFNQNSEYHLFDLHEHTSRVVMNCPKDLDLRWAALLHDIGKPFCRIDKVILEKERENIIKTNYPKHEVVGAEMVKMIGTHLKWSTERIEKVSNLVLHHLEDDCILRLYDNMAK